MRHPAKRLRHGERIAVMIVTAPCDVALLEFALEPLAKTKAKGLP
jgi:hypothetical protein